MDYADFELNVDDPMKPRVVVNDEDVTAEVRRAAVDVRAGELPVLHLEMARPRGHVEGRGVVQVHHEPDVESVLEWLAAIDPAQLEREALNNAGMAGKKTGELFLDALRARARGEAPGG